MDVTLRQRMNKKLRRIGILSAFAGKRTRFDTVLLTLPRCLYFSLLRSSFDSKRGTSAFGLHSYSSGSWGSMILFGMILGPLLDSYVVISSGKLIFWVFEKSWVSFGGKGEENHQSSVGISIAKRKELEKAEFSGLVGCAPSKCLLTASCSELLFAQDLWRLSNVCLARITIGISFLGRRHKT